MTLVCLGGLLTPVTPLPDQHAITTNPTLSRVCGYVFKRGDIAWNCRKCQVDSTCVQCDACFRRSDHTGHPVRHRLFLPVLRALYPPPPVFFFATPSSSPAWPVPTKGAACSTDGVHQQIFREKTGSQIKNLPTKEPRLYEVDEQFNTVIHGAGVYRPRTETVSKLILRQQTRARNKLL